MKAIEYAARVPYRLNRSRVSFVGAVRREIRNAGESYGNAVYDDAGNCKVCGEAGRCPGVHTLEELTLLKAGGIEDGLQSS